MPNRTASATCQTCQTEFDGLPVERDEDGVYAVLEVRPCADPECNALLCECCPTFACDGCGATFCTLHMTAVNELLCCPPCAAASDQGELELASCCPACESDGVTVATYDFGSDPETGYQDVGEAFVCRSCGHRGDPADLVAPAVRPARRPLASETASPARVQEIA